MPRLRITTLLAALAVTLAASAARAQNYNQLKVLSVGGTDGSAYGISINTYNTSGVNQNITWTLPTTTSGNNNRIVEAGSATSDGALTLSANGQYLTTQGYNAAVGTASVASTSATQTIARIDSTGVVNTATTTTAYSNNNIRGSVTTDGNSFYTTGGKNGVNNVSLGPSSTNTQISSTVATLRDINIYNNNLYFSTGSGTTGIYQVGKGLPSSSGTTSTLVCATSGNAYDFYFASDTTLYVADSTAGLLKYTKSGSTFSLATTSPVTGGLTGLTGRTTGTSVSLYGTSADGKLLLSFSDTTSNTAAISPTTLATAATNTVFRGVDFAPVPAPPGLVSMGIGLGMAGLGALVRRRRVA